MGNMGGRQGRSASLHGLSVADVEIVYAASKDKLLTLAAQQHHPNANTPTLISHNLLAITLHWLRRKTTYDELSHLYPHCAHFWHSTVRKVVAALDECIFSRFVPPLAPNAPTAVRFPDVKIIVDTTFVPLPKTRFIPAEYHKRVRRRRRGSTRLRATSLTASSAARVAFMVDNTICASFVSPACSISIMGDKGYRGKLGIVVPASKKAKVSREIKELEDEKQRGHEMQRECHLLWWFLPCGGCVKKSTNKQKSTQ